MPEQCFSVPEAKGGVNALEVITTKVLAEIKDGRIHLLLQLPQGLGEEVTTQMGQIRGHQQWEGKVATGLDSVSCSPAQMALLSVPTGIGAA